MLALLAAFAMPPALEFDVRSGTGLVVRLTGVPVVRGTWFQYSDPANAKRFYFSATGAQQVERTEDSCKLTFRSGDGRAYGTQVYARSGNKLKISYEFNWSGDRPARLDLAAGMLWAKIFQGGSLTIDQKPARSLAPTTYATADRAVRTYGAGFAEAEFQSALGRITVKSSEPSWTLFDGRGYTQSWASGKELFYLGQPSVEVRPGAPFKAEIEYEFDPVSSPGSASSRTAPAVPLALAKSVRQEQPVIIPKPKQALFDRDQPFLIGNALRVDIPDAYSNLKRELVKSIQRWWIVPDLKAPPTNDPNIYCRIENIGLPAEGFEIRANPKNIIVWGQDPAGLRYALLTLGSLAFAKDGKLYFPSGTMRDWPSIAWRGVHLFGGPQLKSFQPKFAERVLEPLRFNRVVLQCERTNWDSQPGIGGPDFNTKADLRAAFAMYRGLGIEPIPLIQSLGHMEWFFSNGQNADLAVNHLVPYTLDLRKPDAQKAIDAIWSEAIELLEPKTIHFGLDEIDSRGMSKLPVETTEIWEKSLPVLSGIAYRNRVTPMMWGDEGLAPTEAIDAAHGGDPGNSKRRRDAFPRGAWVSDWHYKNDPNPDRFMTSLNLWKGEGFYPIASGWFNPDNIAGLTQAAYRTGSGYLQTTWAGYETTEAIVHNEARQFAAYVLAADYAWSGRNDAPDALDYDPAQVLTRLMYAEPSPLSASPGTSLNGPRLVKIEDVAFRVGEPFSLTCLLAPGGAALPAQIAIDTPGLKGRTLALAYDCQQVCEDRDPVANIAIELDDGSVLHQPMLYGLHVRASLDRRKIGAGDRGEGLSSMLIPLGGDHQVKRITIEASSAYAGFRLYGATAY